MKKLMGLLLTAALLTGLLAGCAGTSAESSSTSTPATTETSTPEPSDAPEEAAWPRTIEDDFGHTVTFEKKPERVVVLYFGHIESLFVLGTTPIGATSVASTINGSQLKQYAEQLDIVDIGNPPERERMLELSPDLILGPAYYNSDYEKYNKIAPTLIFDPATWKEILTDYAKCLGAESVAEQLIDGLDSAIIQAREKLSAYQDKTSVVLMDLGKNTFRVRGITNRGINAGMQTNFFNQEGGFGLTPPEGYPEETGEISLEVLADFNPDYIFICSTNGSEANNYESIWFQDGTEDSTIWKSLKAVQSGNVILLPNGSWSGAPLGQKLALETIVDSIVTE